jgi:hypothetical protein
MSTVVEEQRVSWLGICHQPVAGPQYHIPVGNEVPPLAVVIVTQHHYLAGAEAELVCQQVLRTDKAGDEVGAWKRGWWGVGWEGRGGEESRGGVGDSFVRGVHADLEGVRCCIR